MFVCPVAIGLDPKGALRLEVTASGITGIELAVGVGAPAQDPLAAFDGVGF